MVAVVELDDEERYLLAILDGTDGIDIAEFCWLDEEKDDRCFRCWDFQWPWYTTEDTLQIDQAGRSLGKSTGIQMRAFAFPFNYAGSEMLITAPELNHLRPLTDAVEGRILASRMSREMLPRRKGNGLARQPHWQATFANGARIISRLPNKDGRGVKGSIGPDVTVLTRRGLIPVQDVLVGDEVLTHTGQWQRVLDNIRSEADVDMVEIAGGGHRGLQMSWNHRMWARRNSNPQRTRNLEAPTWVIADDDELPQRWYFGSPTRFPEEPLPALPHPDLDALLTLAGAYVADGCQGTGRIVITDDVDDVARILSYADALGASSAVYDKPSRARTIEIFGAELAAWLRKHFGSRAEAKRLPVWLLGADEPYRKAFLNAYLAGDGHWSKSRNRWEASTASRELAVGLRLLGQSLGYSASMSWVDPKPNPLAAAPRRSYRVHLVEGGKVIHDERRHAQWSRVRKVSEIGRGVVYSLIVENDESYLADGIYSHNMHPTVLEGDEMQDFPLAGWIELIETHKRGAAGSQVRFHGVSRGVRDKYWELTQPDSDFLVHHYMAQHRPTWTDEERQEKIKLYQSRQSVDYKRNIYGEHGDASNPVFVLAKLMHCVDTDEGSTYNTEVYTIVRVDYEQIEKGRPIVSFLDPPGTHLHGYSQMVTPDLDNGRTGAPRQAGAPKGYSAYFAGMDVGVTNHPSEILVFGQRKETDVLELLLRVNMRRIGTESQIEMIEAIFDYYGSKLKAFALDKTGVGQPIWDILQRKASIGDRIYGYNFSEKVVTGYQDRDLGPKEEQVDLAIWRNVVEHSTDVLRNDMVDIGRIRIPFDRELLSEWQGQNYTVVKSDGSPYGKRNYSAGKFHTLDAAKMMAAGKTLPAIAAMLEQKTAQAPVYDLFLGASY